MNAKTTWKRIRTTTFRLTLAGVFGLLTVTSRAQTYTTPFNFTTVAGTGGVTGWLDGTNSGALLRANGIATDPAGNIYISENANHLIRQVTQQGTNWIVKTIAGTTNSAYLDGVGTNAQFSSPWTLAVDAATNIYIAGRVDQTIRKISPQGTNWVVSTLAGTALTTGYKDATGTAAKFNIPNGVCVDTNGNVYVSDSVNNRIRKVTPGGVVTTVAGNGNRGYADGSAATAEFYFPHGLRMDKSGNLIVTDTYNHLIRKISPVGTNWVVSTIAGYYYPTPEPEGGFADGTNNTARFNRPYDLALDNYGNIYVSDCYSNRCIRKITPQGNDYVVTTIGGVPGVSGTSDGTGSGAQFWGLYDGITFDAKGNLLVADAAALRVGCPAPRIAREGNKFIVSWAASNYGLEQSASLASDAIWTPVPTPPSLINGSFFSTNSFIQPANFFRLH